MKRAPEDRIATIGALVAGIARFWVAAQPHALHGLAHVDPLVSRDFGIEPQIAPAVKMVPKNRAEEIGAGWAIRAEG
jgi:hypothetical protein